MWKPETDKNIQIAINSYLKNIGYEFTGSVSYSTIIDGVIVFDSGNAVFVVGLPPVSNYFVRETKNAKEYLTPLRQVRKYA